MSVLPCVLLGVIPGVMFGLILAGLLRGNVCPDAWWMGYAAGYHDASSEAAMTVVQEGPVYRRSRDGAA